MTWAVTAYYVVEEVEGGIDKEERMRQTEHRIFEEIGGVRYRKAADKLITKDIEIPVEMVGRIFD